MDLYVPVTYTLWAFAANGAAEAEPSSSVPGAARLDPRVFHTLNLALHLAAGCVVFFLLRDLIPGNADLPALAGAMLFVLHPVQVEPVAWVSGMKDLLMGLLALAAIWQYVRLARDEAQGALIPPGEWWGRYGAASGLFVLAMLSKPTAVVAPLIVIVLDRWVIGRAWKNVIVWTGPWLALAVPVAIIARAVQPAPLAHGGAAVVALWARPLIAADALAFYLYKLIVPAALTFDYGRTPTLVLQRQWHYYTWVMPVAVAGILLALRRRARAVAAGGLILLIGVLPVLGLVRFDFQNFSTVADHYLYLAMLGPALALAWLLSLRPTPLTLGVTGAVLLMLAARTFNQTQYWRDSQALFRHALTVNPSSFVSYNNLAAAAVDAGQYDEAIDLCRLAIALNPWYPPAYLTRGDAFRQSGRGDLAIAAYRTTLQFLPDNGPALMDLAVLLAQKDQLHEALAYARHAVEAEPNLPSARLNLAKMYLALGDVSSARREINVILAADPNNAAARALLNPLPPATAPLSP